MGFLTKFKATSIKNFFSTTFKRNNGVAQLASIDQLNTLIDFVNEQASTDLFTISVTHPIGLPVTYAVTAGACVSGSGSCPTCLVTPCAYKPASSVTIIETSPGTYEFTVSPGIGGGGNSTAKNSYMIIPNFDTVGVAATVAQTAPFVFVVKTYMMATGVVTTNLFKNTIVEIKIISSDPNKCC